MLSSQRKITKKIKRYKMQPAKRLPSYGVEVIVKHTKARMGRNARTPDKLELQLLGQSNGKPASPS